MILLLWTTHVFSLYAGGLSAVQDYLHSLPPENKQALVERGWEVFSQERARFFSQVVGLWSIWGSPVLILLSWALAAQHYLGLDGKNRGRFAASNAHQVVMGRGGLRPDLCIPLQTHDV